MVARMLARRGFSVEVMPTGGAPGRGRRARRRRRPHAASSTTTTTSSLPNRSSCGRARRSSRAARRQALRARRERRQGTPGRSAARDRRSACVPRRATVPDQVRRSKARRRSEASTCPTSSTTTGTAWPATRACGSSATSTTTTSRSSTPGCAASATSSYRSSTAARDAHSGVGGSIFPNAAWRLTWALATLKGRDEQILIPDYYDSVRSPTARDRELIAALPETRRRVPRELRREGVPARHDRRRRAARRGGVRADVHDLRPHLRLSGRGLEDRAARPRVGQGGLPPRPRPDARRRHCGSSARISTRKASPTSRSRSSAATPPAAPIPTIRSSA